VEIPSAARNSPYWTAILLYPDRRARNYPQLRFSPMILHSWQACSRTVGSPLSMPAVPVFHPAETAMTLCVLVVIARVLPEVHPPRRFSGRGPLFAARNSGGASTRSRSNRNMLSPSSSRSGFVHNEPRYLGPAASSLGIITAEIAYGNRASTPALACGCRLRFGLICTPGILILPTL